MYSCIDQDYKEVATLDQVLIGNNQDRRECRKSPSRLIGNSLERIGSIVSLQKNLQKIRADSLYKKLAQFASSFLHRYRLRMLVG